MSLLILFRHIEEEEPAAAPAESRSILINQARIIDPIKVKRPAWNAKYASRRR